MSHKTQIQTQVPQWDLSDLFLSINDPQIEKSWLKIDQDTSRIYKKYYQNIKNNQSVDFFVKLFHEYEDVLQAMAEIVVFAQLQFEVQSNNDKVNRFLQQSELKYQQMSQKLVFIYVELTQLSENKINRLSQAKKLAKYSYFLQEIARNKPHTLSEKEEQILNIKSMTSSSAFSRLFSQKITQKEFKFSSKKIMHEAEVLQLLHSPKQEIRKKASQVFSQGLKEELSDLAFIYNTLLNDKFLEDNLRHFSTPEDSSYLSNNISASVVSNLNKIVKNNYSIVQEFYSLKKKILGVKKLYDYDRYAPLQLKTKKYSFAKTQEIILNTFNNFDSRFKNIAQDFFDHHWIDAQINKGKNGGAFCSFITPRKHPYALVNFQGTANDITVLAHELGHCIHATLSKKQSYLEFSAPLTVCETASIFSEMLVFEELKKQLQNNSQDLKALYLTKIENIFASVFRQISMYNFEKEAHLAYRKEGELSVSELNKIWYNTQKEMFGNSIEITENYHFWWSYIPHFFHTPFYVYAYAFGELLTLSIYGLYKKDGDKIKDKYFQFLEAGGSKTPSELVALFGFNLDDPKFWELGIKEIKKMIQEFKNIK